MDQTISTNQLLILLPEMAARVRRGDRFTVLHRSRPAFRIVPVDDDAMSARPALDDDPMFRAAALGRSTDGVTAMDHDAVLYGTRR